MKARDFCFFEQRPSWAFCNAILWTISFPATLFGFIAKFLPTEPYVHLERVSGYYGPGAYLAWYITATSLGIRLILHKSPTMDCKVDDEESSRIEISGDVLATIAYPIVALVDTTVQLCYSILKGTPLTAEFLAGLCVIEIASTTAHFVETLDRDQDRDGPERHWIIRLVNIANAFLGYNSVFEGRSLVRPWYLALKIVYAVMVMANWHPYHSSRQVRPFLFGIHIVALHVVRLQLPPYSLLPVSACKFSDLDQIAALVTTIAALVFPWKEQLLSQLHLLWACLFCHKYNASDLVSRTISKILRCRQKPADVETASQANSDVQASD